MLTPLLLTLHLALPVHDFYSKECCDNQHCHPVPCDEVIDLKDGWRWRDRTFSRAMLRISQDGACHICTSSIATFCIYLPPRV
jgi:hypothetical protein